VRRVKARGAQARKGWNEKFASWQSANPERAKLLQRLLSGELPKGWDAELPQYPAGKDVAHVKHPVKSLLHLQNHFQNSGVDLQI
jgi:transketolase